MAEALTFLAEEVGRTFALVWSGVKIAARLNYEVMSVLVTFTARMVQLLLLLTQKFAELFSILTHDTMLFLSDIGNGVMAAISAMYSVVNSVCCGIGAIGIGIANACYRVYSLAGLMYTSLVDLLAYLVSQIVNILYLLKCGFVLFGSSVLFGISFLPNLICLLITGSLQLIGNFYLRGGLLLQDSWFAFEYMVTSVCLSVRDFLGDIPIHSLVGACLGVFILLGLKLLLHYMINNFILIPDLAVPSFVTSVGRRLLNWYVGFWQEANLPPTRENSTDEEFDDTSDHNGNDNNDNVPDRNLNREKSLLPPLSLPLLSHSFHSASKSSIVGLASASTSASASAIERHQAEESEVSAFIIRPLVRPPITRRQRIFGLREDVTDDIVREEAGSRKGKEVQDTSVGITREEAGSRKGKEVQDTSVGITKNNDVRRVKQLYKELLNEREDKLCIICQDKPKSVILLPCRHMCLCDSCRSAVITRSNSCPICRKPILDSLSVYIS